MPITIHCSACGKQYAAADRLAGKKITCPQCQTVLDVPANQGVLEVTEFYDPPAAAAMPGPFQPGPFQPGPVQPGPVQPVIPGQVFPPAGVPGMPGQFAPGQPQPGWGTPMPGTSLPAPVSLETLAGMAAGVPTSAGPVAPGPLGPLPGSFKKRSSKKAWIIGGAAGGGLLLVVLIVILLASRKSPQDVANAPPPIPGQPGAAPTPGMAAPDPGIGRNPDGSVPGQLMGDANRPRTETPSNDDKPQTFPAKLWNLTADPLPESHAKFDCNQPIALGFDGFSQPEMYFATSPTPFIAISGERGGRGGQEQSIELWNLETVKPQGKIQASIAATPRARLSPDGRFLVALGNRGNEATESGLHVWSFPLEERIGTLPIDNDGDLVWFDFAGPDELVAARRDAGDLEVMVWNIAKRATQHQFRIPGSSGDDRHFALSPGRKYLAVLDGSSLRAYNLTSGQMAADTQSPTFRFGHTKFWCPAFSSDGRLLAAFGEAAFKKAVFFWNVTKNGAVDVRDISANSLNVHRSADKICPGRDLEWLPGGRGLLLAGVMLVEPQSGETLWQREGADHFNRDGWILDSKRVLALGRHQSNRVLHAIELPEEAIAATAKGPQEPAAGSAEAGLGPLVTADRGGQRKIEPPQEPVAWSAAPDPAGSTQKSFVSAPIPLGTPLVKEVVFSSPAAGQAIVLRAQRETPSKPNEPRRSQAPFWLERHDLATGQQAGQADLPGLCRLMDASPSGGRAVLQSGEGRLDVWSLADGKRLCGWQPYRDKPTVMWAAFVNEDQVLTHSENPRQLVLWKLPECRAAYYLNLPDQSSLVLSPGRKFLVGLQGGKLRVLDALSGDAKGELTVPSGVTLGPWNSLSAAFSPDGTMVAIAWANELMVWNFANGQLVHDLPSVMPWRSCQNENDGHHPPARDEDGAVGHGVARVLNVGRGNLLQWVRGRHLLESGPSGLCLIDLDRHGVVWRCSLSDSWLLPRSPDGRQWALVRSFQKPAYLAPHTLVGDDLLAWIDGRLPQKTTAPLFGPGTAVSVDTGNVNLPEVLKVSRSDIESCLKQSLANRGATAAGGQPLRLAAESSLGEMVSQEFQDMRGRDRRTYKIDVPVIKMRVALLDSAGKVLHESQSAASPRNFSPFERLETDRWNVEAFLTEQCTKWQKQSVQNFFAQAQLPRLVYPTIVDQAGQPGLANADIQLVQLLGIRDEQPDVLAAAPRGSQEVPEPTVMIAGRSNPTPRRRFGRPELGGGEDEAGKADFEKECRDYVRRVAIDLLADDTAIQKQMQWFPAAKRPVFGLRWGAGLQVSGTTEKIPTDLPRDLGRLTGPAGPMVGLGLQQRLTEGQFGQWPARGDEKVRQVAFLGVGSQEELVAAARRQAIDVVALMVFTSRLSGSGKKSEQLRIRLIDVLTEKPLWTSDLLSTTQIAARKGGNPVKEFSDGVMKRVDDEYGLQPMPQLSAETAKKRAQSLVSPETKPANPLLVLVELRYYQAKGLLSPEEAAPLYDAVLGAGKGKAFATADPDGRRILALEAMKAGKDNN